MMNKLILFTICFTGASALIFNCNKYDNDCQKCSSKSLCVYDITDSKCKSSLNIFLNKRNIIPLPLSCPAELPSFTYTDDFGRNRALVYSMASNGETKEAAQRCLTNHVNGASVFKQYTVECDLFDSNCSATLSVDPEAKAIVVSFRGTKGAAQFIIQALTLIFKTSKADPQYYKGKVFTYFADAFDKLWNSGLHHDILELKQNNSLYEIEFFGHSLGGSLALIAGNAISKEGHFSKDEIKIVTLGSPRTGNYEFAEDVSTNVPNTYRIIRETDLITKLPLKVFLKQKTEYHNNFEAWYDNDMSPASPFKINNRADDHSGSQAVPYNGESVHNSYFGVDMETYNSQYCA